MGSNCCLKSRDREDSELLYFKTLIEEGKKIKAEPLQSKICP